MLDCIIKTFQADSLNHFLIIDHEEDNYSERVITSNRVSLYNLKFGEMPCILIQSIASECLQHYLVTELILRDSNTVPKCFAFLSTKTQPVEKIIIQVTTQIENRETV